jgi:hypothetical protein
MTKYLVLNSFSIVDVVEILTDSPNPQVYWRVMKKRLKDEGNETVTICNGLKMKALDGKMRLTDVANPEQLLRIIQSIPSPKADPFKIYYFNINRTILRSSFHFGLSIARIFLSSWL